MARLQQEYPVIANGMIVRFVEKDAHKPPEVIKIREAQPDQERADVRQVRRVRAKLNTQKGPAGKIAFYEITPFADLKGDELAEAKKERGARIESLCPVLLPEPEPKQKKED